MEENVDVVLFGFFCSFLILYSLFLGSSSLLFFIIKYVQPALLLQQYYIVLGLRIE